MPRAAVPRSVEISAAARALRRDPGWATLDICEDYVALGQVASGYRRSMVVKLMAGIILHGLYHRAALECMATALRLPSDRGLSGMEWAIAAQGGYDDMLNLGWEYHGPQGFRIAGSKVVLRLPNRFVRT